MSLIDDGPDAVNQGGGPGNTPEFSVSEISGAVKRMVEGEFGHVRVRGEVGRVSRPRSGHVYLDLKDDRAVLAGVMWKGVAARLTTQPEEGMEVVATGRLTTFPGQSKYQIVIEQIAPAGVGALMAMLEKRKAALAAEGLFDQERKRQIPFLPGVIGVVTSPSGAVIRDILHRLGERFPTHVLVWPVAVQGEKCAPEVARAIAGFAAMEGAMRPDLVIVARGGGSVEDLWGFNDEAVVRAAAASAIPLISAVGHETDWTLIDLAADLRAPTPSAAAERAVPVRADLLASLADLEARRVRAQVQRLDRARQRLADLARALPRPERLLDERRQRLDLALARLPRPADLLERRRDGLARLADRLPVALSREVGRWRLRLSDQAGSLKPGLLDRRIERGRDRVGAKSALLPAALRRVVDRERLRLSRQTGRIGPSMLRDRLGEAQTKFSGLARLYGSLHYSETLKRGFALVRSDGQPIADASSAPPGTVLEIEFRDGRLAAVAGEGSEPPQPPKKKSARKPKPTADGGQGTLF
ncbi:MAG: exodeoxyribonuclease VII large subunit [Pseudomonadota bacterium]